MKKIAIADIKPEPGQGVYVYQFPVRLWHWTIAACIFTLFVTGYYIANPPHSTWGDATYLFSFGKIIRIHYTAGLILCVFMLWRCLFAIWGNSISREIFIVPVWRKSWWKGIWNNIKWYLFIKKTPDIDMGHDPLAQIAMFAAVLAMIFMCLTGLGIFQAKGYNSFFSLFGFVENAAYAAGGNGFNLVKWHYLGNVFLIAFVMIHVYMVIRADIMGRTTMISTMVNGERLVKATPKEDWLDLQAEEKKAS